MRRAVRIELTDDERATLVKWSRGKRTQVRLVHRARMILLASDDLENKEIAEELKTSQQCVGKWRKRFAEHRLSGIEKDLPRGGRKPSVRSKLEATIVRQTSRRSERTPHNGRCVPWRKRSELVRQPCSECGVTTV
jgi:transposase